MSSDTAPAIDAAGLILRMRRAMGCPRDADLAEALGLSVSAVSKWRQRNSVPLEAVLTVAERSGLSSDHLIHGDLSVAGRILGATGSAVARGLGLARHPMLIKGGVMAVAMERAAQEWAGANQGRDLTVFDLGERAGVLYGNYLVSVASDPEHETEILDAMATVLRPLCGGARSNRAVWPRCSPFPRCSLDMGQINGLCAVKGVPFGTGTGLFVPGLGASEGAETLALRPVQSLSGRLAKLAN